MATHVISLRLLAAVDAALRASALDARLSASEALDWLLRKSFGNSDSLRALADCPRPWNAKLDGRIQRQTSHQLKLAAEELSISVSAYSRRLLYHYYITKRVSYPESDGHYTLVVRHD
jgi:hypothetical protein